MLLFQYIKEVSSISGHRNKRKWQASFGYGGNLGKFALRKKISNLEARSGSVQNIEGSRTSYHNWIFLADTSLDNGEQFEPDLQKKDSSKHSRILYSAAEVLEKANWSPTSSLVCSIKSEP